MNTELKQKEKILIRSKFLYIKFNKFLLKKPRIFHYEKIGFNNYKISESFYRENHIFKEREIQKSSFINKKFNSRIESKKIFYLILFEKIAREK